MGLVHAQSSAPLSGEDVMKKKMQTQMDSLVKFVQDLTAVLAKAASGFPVDSPAMTPDAKRRTLKARKGGTRIIVSIAELVKTHGLDSNALHSSAMIERLDVA